MNNEELADVLKQWKALPKEVRQKVSHSDDVEKTVKQLEKEMDAGA